MTRVNGIDSLHRNTIGFDQFFNIIASGLSAAESSTFPRYNIEKLGENEYRLKLAVAGYSMEDLSIELKEDQLKIDGQKYDQAEENVEVIHKGISSRKFSQRFGLGPNMKVDKAELSLGMLTIYLKREVPPELLPQKIPIQEGD